MTHPTERIIRLAAIITVLAQVVTHAGSYPLLLICAVALCALELYEARHHR